MLYGRVMVRARSCGPPVRSIGSQDVVYGSIRRGGVRMNRLVYKGRRTTVLLYERRTYEVTALAKISFWRS